MTDLILTDGDTKPHIHFSVEKGILSIKGKSILDHAEIVFEPMNNWIKEYSKTTVNKKTTIEIALEYFNSSTAKALIRFLIIAKNNFLKNQLFVNFYYDDESILDYGEDFAEVTGLFFNFVEKKYH